MRFDLMDFGAALTRGSLGSVLGPGGAVAGAVVAVWIARDAVDDVGE